MSNDCGSKEVTVSQAAAQKKVQKAVADEDCAKRCGILNKSKNTMTFYTGVGATDEEAYADWQSKWECSGECKGAIAQRTGNVIAIFEPSGVISSRWCMVRLVIATQFGEGKLYTGKVGIGSGTMVFSDIPEGSYSVTSLSVNSADCGTGSTITANVKLKSYTEHFEVKSGLGNEGVIRISADVTCNY